MKAAKVGFFSTPSCTPDVTVFAAKANTLPTRSGWRMARSRPRMAPSLQPHHVGLGDGQRVEQGDDVVGRTV
jgi:hypothetical protein